MQSAKASPEKPEDRGAKSTRTSLTICSTRVVSLDSQRTLSSLTYIGSTTHLPGILIIIRGIEKNGEKTHERFDFGNSDVLEGVHALD